jgi:hypothetical protein
MTKEMEDSKMRTSKSKEELHSDSLIYDYLEPILESAIKRSSILLNPIRKEMSFFADKNANVLQTNIIGKQLLVNKQMESNILEAIGVEKGELLEKFKQSDYFKQFGQLQLRDQLLFAIPLIILSKKFYEREKMNESKFFYASAFYKPYATVVFKYFGKYEVNEDQMRYTIENLSERYDIKKQGTLIGVISKMAESSYENYIIGMTKSSLTDKDLHIIFQSGIYSRLNNFVQPIFGEYQNNKGKRLYFEDPTFEGTGDSEGEEFDKDIQSDSSIKDNLIKKAVMEITKKQPDEKLLEIAAKFGFVGTGATMGQYKFSGMYTNVLRSTISEMIEKYYKKLPLLIEGIIGSFLFEINPATGEKYSARDLKTAVFASNVTKIFAKSPNAKNENVLKVREMMNDILENVSNEYINWGSTKKSALKKAVHFYLVLIIQKG